MRVVRCAWVLDLGTGMNGEALRFSVPPKPLLNLTQGFARQGRRSYPPLREVGRWYKQSETEGNVTPRSAHPRSRMNRTAAKKCPDCIGRQGILAAIPEV